MNECIQVRNDTGKYDHAPSSQARKLRVIRFWRRHFEATYDCCSRKMDVLYVCVLPMTVCAVRSFYLQVLCCVIKTSIMKHTVCTTYHIPHTMCVSIELRTENNQHMQPNVWILIDMQRHESQDESFPLSRNDPSTSHLYLYSIDAIGTCSRPTASSKHVHFFYY